MLNNGKYIPSKSYNNISLNDSACMKYLQVQ